MTLEDQLKALRPKTATDMIVSFGAHGSSHDCPDGHVSVTLMRGTDVTDGNALSLDNAINIATWKLDGIVRLRAEKVAKEKKDAGND